MKKQRGFAALLIIFVLGMVSLLVASGLLITGYNESQMARTEASGTAAFYEANSGVEEALYKINHVPNYGVGSPATFTVSMNSGSASIIVHDGTATQRTIDSTGTSGTYVSEIHTVVQNTSVTPGFMYAIQAGPDGFELDNNSTIQALSGDGNIYSNGYIKGKNNGSGLCTSGSPSLIKGSAWAVTSIDKLNPGTGVCVMKNAYANNLSYCNVIGNRNSPNSPSGNCNGGSYINSPAPTPIPLPDMGVDALKNYVISKGTTFTGDCTADGSLSSNNCAGTSNILGNIIITGNLVVNVPSGSRLNFSGPVWVKGSITFNSHTTVGLAAATTISQIVVSDNTINSASNVTFCTNSISCLGGTAYLMFLSTYPAKITPTPTPTPSPAPEGCSNPAITIQSNSNSVLFYAPSGCVSVSANSTFQGAILGQKIVVNANSTVNYDPNLATAIFGLTQSGGWQTMSFSQQ